MTDAAMLERILAELRATRADVAELNASMRAVRARVDAVRSDVREELQISERIADLERRVRAIEQRQPAP